MLKLAHEIEHDDSLSPVDSRELIRETVSLAEKGFWDIRLKLPGGRRLKVRQIVRMYGLERLISPSQI